MDIYSQKNLDPVKNSGFINPSDFKYILTSLSDLDMSFRIKESIDKEKSIFDSEYSEERLRQAARVYFFDLVQLSRQR